MTVQALLLGQGIGRPHLCKRRVAQAPRPPFPIQMVPGEAAIARAGHMSTPAHALTHSRACGRAMVGQTLHQKYRYYRCRAAFAGSKHDRCESKYVRADGLEDAVRAACDR